MKEKGYYCNCINCGHPVNTPMDYCPKCSSALPRIQTKIKE